MQKSASAINVGQSTQSGDVPNRSIEAIMSSNEQNIPSVQEGGKSRRKRTKRKRTKRRSSVRQRR
jgi:hypothetical protein